MLSKHIHYGTKDIKLVRGGLVFYRPTKFNPSWGTSYKYPNLHFDFDPGSYKDINRIMKRRKKKLMHTQYCEADGNMYQGFINLIDNKEQDGGFICSPGSHIRFDKWYEEVKKKLPHEESGTNIFKIDFSRPQDS